MRRKALRNRRGFIAAGIILLLTCALLFLMARPPICTCGHVELWHGALDSGNSQHIADWYSLSHVIHGFLFYAGAWALMRRQPIGPRFALAVLVESVWEILENSPIIINPLIVTAFAAFAMVGHTRWFLAWLGCHALLYGTVVILDETGAAGRIYGIVSYASGAAIMLFLHWALDRAYVIEAGRIVASGPAAQIAADGTLEKAYLG